ncbi:hypothetical protein HWB91_gp36 [Bacillus phage vB_BboS-125]|uniref:Uncharacterized protein n=1 Tax=Bacillus phage vB_BboS-125 TaxID=2419618 RepID=A0A3G3BWC2_9CAUD|nr:hypothetical protein HWB91_gp36 [Bacillus phage vB_BboS-125]AYP68406.1 hypothetical protein BboS125_00036 [Bacillus phage vB_BboS-125]
MCIKCEISKILADAMGVEVKEEVVGRIPEENRQELLQLEKAGELMKKEIEAALKKAAEEVAAKYRPKEEAYEKLATKAWDDALVAAGMDPEADDYDIDRRTGEVSVTKVKEKAPAGSH